MRFAAVLWVPATALVAPPTLAAESRPPGAGEGFAHPLDLNEAIRVALVNNPEVAAADQDVAIFRSQHEAVVAGSLPSVHGIAGYSRFFDDQRLVAARENGEPGVFGKDFVSADLTLAIPLFTGWKDTNESAATELLWRASIKRVSRNRQELVYNVSNLFYTILAHRHFLDALESLRAAVEAHRKQVVELIDAQKVARVDLLRAEVRAADLAQKALRERNLLAIERRALANLLGLGAGRADVDVRGSLELSAADPDQPADVLVSQALARREDLLSARLSADAQAKSVDAAASGYWPTISLQGSYGWRWAASPSDRPSGTDIAEDVGRVGIVLDMPLFEGGRTDARVAEQRARVVAARERLRKLELQIRLEVETAVLNVSSARERVLVTQKSIQQAEESLRIEHQKYDYGKGAIIDVLDAQAALLDAQASYARALADHGTALAQRKLALGETP